MDQGRAYPFFQCTKPAAERRLRDVTGFGRAGEVAMLDDRQEVLQPRDLHPPALLNHVPVLIRLASRPRLCNRTFFRLMPNDAKPGAYARDSRSASRITHKLIPKQHWEIS